MWKTIGAHHDGRLEPVTQIYDHSDWLKRSYWERSNWQILVWIDQLRVVANIGPGQMSFWIMWKEA